MTHTRPTNFKQISIDHPPPPPPRPRYMDTFHRFLPCSEGMQGNSFFVRWWEFPELPLSSPHILTAISLWTVKMKSGLHFSFLIAPVMITGSLGSLSSFTSQTVVHLRSFNGTSPQGVLTGETRGLLRQTQ